MTAFGRVLVTENLGSTSTLVFGSAGIVMLGVEPSGAVHVNSNGRRGGMVITPGLIATSKPVEKRILK